MNICLYGASSDDIAKSYITATEDLGRKIALKGHNLVFGGGALGLMGAAARGTVSCGGKVIGVAPSFFQVDGILFNQCTEFIYTETMRQRKEILENKSDAFIMVPGGPGTFDEFFEILTLKQLGQHRKPIAVFNINGYYDELYRFLEAAVEKKFMSRECLKLAYFSNSADKIIEFLENYDSENYDFKEFKKYIVPATK